MPVVVVFLGEDGAPGKKREPGECQMCGMVEELRPLGPYGENICIACGMKDNEGTQERYLEIMTGMRSARL